MPIQNVEVTLQGESPLLMHAFPLEPIESQEKMEPKRQAEIAAYRDPDSQELYVPSVAIQRALVSAATYSKGKGRATLQRPAAACLLVSPERVTLGVKEYMVDSRPVVVPATKGRVLRHRPRLDAWKIVFNLEWDDTLLKQSEVRRIVDDMGKRVGLLDFRPEKKGPFGRCVVVKWNGG